MSHDMELFFENKEILFIVCQGHKNLGDLGLMHEFSQLALIYLVGSFVDTEYWPQGLDINVQHWYLSVETDGVRYLCRDAGEDGLNEPVTGFCVTDEIRAFVRQTPAYIKAQRLKEADALKAEEAKQS
ncbi:MULTISPECIES: hypothetical protein [unclassified Pseudovibrio]|uniref:hypothetical protein n=1 Tax=unclassified Pseudovibrio TaxID=2627060 RepID=UPI0007AE8B4D|nr:MULTISPECIES: hypothetical protein [unclassified Pseudovibrio]KZK95833.1 hypothetical protein PsAD5_02867 [Pseudovibrio sp. Ad5]KZL00429.1 hypothetical protein PsW74_02854 [Pseudovibrio sp. W74]KZL07429.1 hypothetical protein PsAD14_03814 [Pseudovibrio sp. Ad14]